MAIVYNGDMTATYTQMFGGMHPNTARTIQTNLDAMMNAGYSDTWSQQMAVQQFQDYGLRSITIAQNNLVYLGSSLFDDALRNLYTTLDFQVASPKTQEYMMSHPYFHDTASKGRIEGWGLPLVENNHGINNIYFRAATNGLVLYGDEVLGEEDKVFDDLVRIYMDDEDDDTVPKLSVKEQITIRDNWLRLYQLLNQESEEPIEDPTSLNGAYL